MPLSQAVKTDSNKRRDAFQTKTNPNARALNWKFKGDGFFKYCVYQNVFAAIKSLPEPAPNSADPKPAHCLTLKASDMDFAGWFNYFYAEAEKTGQLSDEDIGRLMAMIYPLDSMLEAVEKPPNALEYHLKRAFALHPPAIRANDALRAIGSNALALDILSYLLALGFDHAETAKVRSATCTIEDSTHQFGRIFGMKSAVTGLQSSLPGDRRFAYRGDSRDPATVVSHGGAKCRADMAWWTKENHVLAEWHPWKSSGLDTSKMWIRKGSKDNDYFTANSVALDFHIACAYPIFRAREVVEGISGEVNTWTAEKQKQFRTAGAGKFNKPSICKIKARGAGEAKLALFDTVRIYVFYVDPDAEVAKTYMLDNYPEAALREIPLQSLLACFTVERVHVYPDADPTAGYYESTRAEPVAMTCKATRWAFVNGENPTKTHLGLTDDGMRLMKQRFDALLNAPFDITHRQLKTTNGGATHFDFTTKASAPWPEVAAAKPVKLSN